MRLVLLIVSLGSMTCAWAFGPDLGGPNGATSGTDNQFVTADPATAPSTEWSPATQSPPTWNEPAPIQAPAPPAAGPASAAPSAAVTGTADPVPAQAVSSEPASAAPAERTDCCRVCRRRQACGDVCISRREACHRPPGCACDG